jgi:hypothetical protein
VCQGVEVLSAGGGMIVSSEVDIRLTDEILVEIYEYLEKDRYEAYDPTKWLNQLNQAFENGYFGQGDNSEDDNHITHVESFDVLNGKDIRIFEILSQGGIIKLLECNEDAYPAEDGVKFLYFKKGKHVELDGQEILDHLVYTLKNDYTFMRHLQ